MYLDSFKRRPIDDTKEYEVFSKEFDSYIDFFEDLSDLISYNGRMISLITNSKIHYLDTSLLDSSAQTLKSIKLCCSIGSFSDANTLIRKLRDDLLLYAYLLDTMNQRKPFVEEDLKDLRVDDPEAFTSSFMNLRLNDHLTEDEQAIEAWFNNTVGELTNQRVKKKLSFENYMKRLKENENIKQILDNYNLQEYWEKLRHRLNNYVHNNGRQFTYQNFVSSDHMSLEIFLKNINVRTSYISSFFLVLLLMIESSLICSTNLIDYLDGGVEPPEDCQYEIATFVQEFIDAKVSKLHPELKQYLKDNNNQGMRID